MDQEEFQEKWAHRPRPDRERDLLAAAERVKKSLGRFKPKADYEAATRDFELKVISENYAQRDELAKAVDLPPSYGLGKPSNGSGET